MKTLNIVDTFDYVLSLMKIAYNKGERAIAYREEWEAKGHFVSLELIEGLGNKTGFPTLIFHCEGTNRSVWHPQQHDLLIDDWIIKERK